MRPNESYEKEIICFDGKAWFAPSLGGQRLAGSEKMPNNRLRQDINQISLEIIRLAAVHTHPHCIFWGL